MATDLTAFSRDPVAFIDRFIKRNELGQPFALTAHQRAVLMAAFAFDADGKLPWDVILWSEVKKSGKTTINAAVTLWWGFTQEAPNELKLVANDQEQSVARTFTTIKGLLKHNSELGASAEVQASRILLSNGTVIDAIANDYSGEAGANQGWSSWTELWAFVSESSRRLWEELTPVPTRRNSIRFIDTYAGFEGESDLLFDLYKLGVGTDEHPQGQGERLHSSLPVYGNRAARVFAYWSHEPRMPWQTAAYYAAQRRTLRPNTYLRLHENRWTTGVSTFIEGALWDGCVDASYRRPLRPTDGVYVGVDAGIKHDTAGAVAVMRSGDRIELVAHRIWKPSAAEPLDLEATIEAYLRELCGRMDVRAILADPYQMHRSITTLKSAGLPIREYPQTTANCTAMGQALFDALKGRQLRLYPDDELRAQALNCVAVESTRGWRLAKEKTSKKIDAVVALAMAVVEAVSVNTVPFALVNIEDDDDFDEDEDHIEAREAEGPSAGPGVFERVREKAVAMVAGMQAGRTHPEPSEPDLPLTAAEQDLLLQVNGKAGQPVPPELKARAARLAALPVVPSTRFGLTAEDMEKLEVERRRAEKRRAKRGGPEWLQEMADRFLGWFPNDMLGGGFDDNTDHETYMRGRGPND